MPTRTPPDSSGGKTTEAFPTAAAGQAAYENRKAERADGGSQARRAVGGKKRDPREAPQQSPRDRGTGSAPGSLSPFTNSEAPPSTSEAAGSILNRARSSEARVGSELMALRGSTETRSQGRDLPPRGTARCGPRCWKCRPPHRNRGTQRAARRAVARRDLDSTPAGREPPPDKATASGYQATGGALATAFPSLCLRRPGPRWAGVPLSPPRPRPPPQRPECARHGPTLRPRPAGARPASRPASASATRGSPFCSVPAPGLRSPVPSSRDLRRQGARRASVTPA